jgi:hypothetical protein
MAEPEPVFNTKLPIPNNEWEVPDLSYGQNPEVPSFSGAASLEYNKKCGRHLRANRNIETGNPIFTRIIKFSFVLPDAIEDCFLCLHSFF